MDSALSLPVYPSGSPVPYFVDISLYPEFSESSNLITKGPDPANLGSFIRYNDIRVTELFNGANFIGWNVFGHTVDSVTTNEDLYITLTGATPAFTPTDLISLDQAKNYLQVDFDDQDDVIITIIQTAINWIETYTGQYMYQRSKVYYSASCETRISDYPIVIGEITDIKGEVVTPIILNRTLSIIIKCPTESTINAVIGYANASDVPAPMITATYKLITYLYENRDSYLESLPTDVQFLINQYRRSPTL